MRHVVWALALGACGRFSFDERVDADVPQNDSAVALCDPATPFTSVQGLGGINSTGYDSTFTPVADEKTAFFYTDRTGDTDIWIATRPDLSTAWTASRLPSINSTSVDKEPAPSADGSVLAFVSTRPPADSGGDLYYATFDGATYNLVGPITNLDTPMIDYHPFFEIGSSNFWFSSNRSGSLSIYRSTYSAGTFSDGVLMNDLEAGGGAEVAIVAKGGLVMYFRSNRVGGTGGIDIYVATRASQTDTWGNIREVKELNSTALDTPNWISPDLCRLYFSSSVTDASDIFLATRAPP